jgi:membrane protein YdbS with pleckstrin-like domain
MRRLFIIIPLAALLAAAIWFAVYSWNAIEGPPIPAAGYVAMALGIVFSLLVGCGLMALLFYSSRHGYDTPAQYDMKNEQKRM